MKPIVNGKKPVSQKTVKYSAYQANLLDLPPEVAKALEEKGMEARWINYNRYVTDGNFHQEGWTPFKPEKSSDSNGFFFGNNPDGYIRRKELVLACRSKEICESHRAHLREKAARLKASVDSDFRRQMKESGFSKVIEDSDND